MKMIKGNSIILWSITLGCLLLPAVLTAQANDQRIVSLNGAVSEMLCAVGLEQQIAGVDVTSNYPASLQNKKGGAVISLHPP